MNKATKDNFDMQIRIKRLLAKMQKIMPMFLCSVKIITVFSYKLRLLITA